MQGLVILGLVLIVLGWALQVFFAYKGEREIHMLFLICYALGTFVLALDGFLGSLWLPAVLNTLTLIGAALVIKKIGIKK
ncbi:MAG: hypothetical protein WC309_04115 [Candidatus Paceibacterota bacterium]|jgi:ABC-type enterochelin transport system permease subunit